MKHRDGDYCRFVDRYGKEREGIICFLTTTSGGGYRFDLLVYEGCGFIELRGFYGEDVEFLT